MSFSTRAALWTSLAVALTQLALAGGVSTSELTAVAITESRQFHDIPYRAVDGTRAGSFDRAVEGFPDAPLTSAQTSLASPSTFATRPSQGSRGKGSVGDHLLLPPSRAPPARS